MAIARAIAASPEVMLVDRALDSVMASKLPMALDAVFGVANTTTLVISESPTVLDRCDRVVTLKNGEFIMVRQTKNKRGTDGEG